MSNKKTTKARVMHAALREDSINVSTLRRRMRIPTTEMDPTSFNNTVMRTTRQLAADGLLKRTTRGEYKITKRGVKSMVA